MYLKSLYIKSVKFSHKELKSINGKFIFNELFLLLNIESAKSTIISVNNAKITYILRLIL